MENFWDGKGGNPRVGKGSGQRGIMLRRVAEGAQYAVCIGLALGLDYTHA